MLTTTLIGFGLMAIVIAIVIAIIVALGLVYINSRFERSDARWDARFNRSDARFDSLDARFNRSDARFDGLDAHLNRSDAKLDDAVEMLTGRTATTWAYLSTIQVRVRQENNDTTYGCGTLVRMNDRFFIATVAHLTDDFPGNLVLIHQYVDLYTYNRYALVISGLPITWPTFDLALVPVHMRQFPPENARTVSRLPTPIGEMLWGLSVQGQAVVFQHCRALETWGIRGIEADCGGNQGFSGTGYESWDGVLLGIHSAGVDEEHAGHESADEEQAGHEAVDGSAPGSETSDVPASPTQARHQL
jgi:hypothetical protein